MKKSFIALIAPLLVAGAFGAQAEEKLYGESSPQGGFRGRLVETVATVEAIDQQERLVTLKEDDGVMTTIRVGDKVKNLKQVKKGDRVSIQYYESVAWDLIKKKYREEPTKSVSETTTRAEPGQQPSGQTTREVRLIAEVQKVDKRTPSITLKGPEGRVETVIVQDVKNLKDVKVGDQLDIRFTEALAVSLEKAPK